MTAHFLTAYRTIAPFVGKAVASSLVGYAGQLIHRLFE
jgi:hypothetical protein